MQVVCGECGQPFAAKSPKAKWCSDRCRKRNERRPSPSPTPARKSAPPAAQLDGAQAALLEQLTDSPPAPKTPAAPAAREAPPASDPNSSAEAPAEPPAPPEPPEPSEFEKATRLELERLGAVNTMLGQQAIVIARRVAGETESGSATATLSREHGRLMEQIEVRARKQQDPVEKARSAAPYVYRGSARPPEDSTPTAAAS